MIPDIGFMIGCYIITKMFSLINREEEAVITKIFSIITMLITVVCVFDLLSKGLGTN